ncbi:MAG: ankyrin repeat domain-containing protein [archaeon]|nr:ankyrin repeat domain-containing protein [archaeon]
MAEENPAGKGLNMDQLNMAPDEDEIPDTGSDEDKQKQASKKFFEICKNGLKTEKDKARLNKLLKYEYFKILDVDENQWTGLQWAVVNNHPEVIKIIYEEALKAKKKKKKEEEEKKEEEKKVRKLNDLDENFKKPFDAATNGEYTPLHWSAYKGYDVISSILLKFGCKPSRVDRSGNTALHHACASNKMSTFKLFMGLGIDLECKNARSHTPIDLITDKAILELVKKCLNTKVCSICQTPFDFFHHRFICSIKDCIICEACTNIDYYYETETSEEKEVRDCRCKNCQSEIEKVETDLKNAIQSGVLEKVTEQFNISKNYKICEHLKKEARETEDRLTREKQVTELLDSLKVVENHKTINKSVDTLVKMLEDAENHGVEMDIKIVERALNENKRLKAEKDLRTVLDNLTVQMASPENLDNLTQKVNQAKTDGVSAVYVDVGDDLVTKITKNLAAKDLLQKFCEYPIREYPEVEEVDPKKSKIFI